MKIENLEKLYRNAEVVFEQCGEGVVKCVKLYGVASGNKLAYDREGNKQVSYEDAVVLLQGPVQIYDVAATTTCIPVAYKENSRAIEVTVVVGTAATTATAAFKQFKSTTKAGE